MGMAWHEMYTASSKFSRSSKSSLYAAIIMVLSQAQTLLSWQNSSRIPCPSQRKHTFPWMDFTVALGAISKNDKRKGPGTYRSARLTSDLEKISQPVFLGCINKHCCEEQKLYSFNQQSPDLPGTNDVQQTWVPPTTK